MLFTVDSVSLKKLVSLQAVKRQGLPPKGSSLMDDAHRWSTDCRLYSTVEDLWIYLAGTDVEDTILAFKTTKRPEIGTISQRRVITEWRIIE